MEVGKKEGSDDDSEPNFVKLMAVEECNGAKRVKDKPIQGRV